MKKILIFLIFITAIQIQAETRRPIIFDDLYDYPQIKSISLSPDGKNIVCQVKRYDLADDSYVTNLWMVPTDGGPISQFTNSGSESDPCWSPDGETIAFISERPDSKTGESTYQVWLDW